MMQRRPLYRLSPPLSPRVHVLYLSGKGNICINWAKDDPVGMRAHESFGEVDSNEWSIDSSKLEDMKTARQMKREG